MTKQIRRGLGVMLLAALFLPLTALAQTTYTVLPESKMWVDGTSNRSDWTVDATSMTGHITMTDNTVDEVVMNVSSTLKAPKGPIMQRLMDQALQITDYDQVTYELTSATPAEGEGELAFNTTGNLTLVGVTNEIEMLVTGERMDNGQITFTGSHTIQLADYKVKPPTAMFGQLRTGKEVVVNFELLVAPE